MGGGCLVYGEPTRQGASAAGEMAPLVSVMSGQSLGVLGPEIGHAAPSERPDPLTWWPILSCSSMMEGHHETFTAKSLLKLGAKPHYLNNMTT